MNRWSSNESHSKSNFINHHATFNFFSNYLFVIVILLIHSLLLLLQLKCTCWPLSNSNTVDPHAACWFALICFHEMCSHSLTSLIMKRTIMHYLTYWNYRQFYKVFALLLLAIVLKTSENRININIVERNMMQKILNYKMLKSFVQTFG
jgi:hypothetical protein